MQYNCEYLTFKFTYLKNHVFLNVCIAKLTMIFQRLNINKLSSNYMYWQITIVVIIIILDSSTSSFQQFFLNLLITQQTIQLWTFNFYVYILKNPCLFLNVCMHSKINNDFWRTNIWKPGNIKLNLKRRKTIESKNHKLYMTNKII